MLGDVLLGILGWSFAVAVTVMFCWVGPAVLFNAIKQGVVIFAEMTLTTLERLNKPLPPKRTAIQKKFNTDLTWHEVRWSNARMEHELFAPDDWTHDVQDCVHPECNKTALEKLAAGEYLVSQAEVERLGKVWNGVKATWERPEANPMPGNKQKH